MALALCRFLLRDEGGTLTFVRNEEVAWVRHEALSRVQHSLMLPLVPAGNPAAPPPRPPLSLGGHFMLNVLQLKVRSDRFCLIDYLAWQRGNLHVSTSSYN